jgi:hypothetical protein
VIDFELGPYSLDFCTPSTKFDVGINTIPRGMIWTARCEERQVCEETDVGRNRKQLNRYRRDRYEKERYEKRQYGHLAVKRRGEPLRRAASILPKGSISNDECPNMDIKASLCMETMHNLKRVIEHDEIGPLPNP